MNLVICLLSLALMLQPPTTEPSGAFEQALAGLQALEQENRHLRARLAALQEDLPVVTARAGSAVHVRVDELEPLGEEAHRRLFSWDFGDAEGAYNQLGGFNAAHLYETPGSYVIRLNGRPVRRVVVEPDARPIRAVRDEEELAAAARVGGLIVQLPPGAMSVRRTIALSPGTLVLGAQPGSQLVWAGEAGGVMFDAPGGNVTLRGISFDSPFADGFEKNAAEVLRAGGSDIALLDCTFLNVSYGINGNRRPQRVLIQGCRAPLETGLRAYLAWVEGSQWVILGNSAVNSTREHIVRCGASGPQAPGARFLLIAHNDFANLDRREVPQQPDRQDIAKSCLILQVGELGWVEHNLFRGISGVGPLGQADGLREPERRFRYAVFRNNRHLDTLHVVHGAEHVHIADSRFELPASGGDAFSSIKIEGFHRQYNRGVVDVTLHNNVLVSPFGNACQLWVQGPVAQRMELAENRFISGPGSYRWPTMPIVIEGGWQPHYTSRQNQYAPAPGGWPDKSAVVRVGNQNEPASYLTPAAWSRLPNVSGDRFGAAE